MKFLAFFLFFFWTVICLCLYQKEWKKIHCINSCNKIYTIRAIKLGIYYLRTINQKTNTLRFKLREYIQELVRKRKRLKGGFYKKNVTFLFIENFSTKSSYRLQNRDYSQTFKCFFCFQLKFFIISLKN